MSKLKAFKRIGATTALLSILAITTPAQAKDACETVLCMSGLVQGVGVVNNCSGPVKDYFSIVKKKRGKFSASRTSSARLSFLNSCPSHSSWASKINNKYGRTRSLGF